MLPKWHVPPNSNVCLNVLPNLYVCSYVCLSVLTNSYVRSYMRQNSHLLPNSDELIFAHTKKKIGVGHLGAVSRSPTIKVWARYNRKRQQAKGRLPLGEFIFCQNRGCALCTAPPEGPWSLSQAREKVSVVMSIFLSLTLCIFQ